GHLIVPVGGTQLRIQAWVNGNNLPFQTTGTPSADSGFVSPDSNGVFPEQILNTSGTVGAGSFAVNLEVSWMVQPGASTQINLSPNGSTTLTAPPSPPPLATPSISTIPGGPVVIGTGAKLTDSSQLSGGNNPGGTITFYLFAPGVTPDATNSNNVY